MNSRVMYIELKKDGLRGPARIGRVATSKSGKTLYYAGRTLAPLKGHGLKANYFDVKTLEEFWISGPTADGSDSLYPTTVEIDEDARDEYWRGLRSQSEGVRSPSYKSQGRSRRERSQQEKAVRRRNMDRRWQPVRFRVTEESRVPLEGVNGEEGMQE